jgi:hypothetical protein
VRKRYSHPHPHDRQLQIFPLLIDERNHTDEPDCEYWPCKNIYTRCDGVWTCSFGEDEENCTARTKLFGPVITNSASDASILLVRRSKTPSVEWRRAIHRRFRSRPYSSILRRFTVVSNLALVNRMIELDHCTAVTVSTSISMFVPAHLLR